MTPERAREATTNGRRLRLAAVVAVCLAAATGAQAQAFLEDAQLVDLSVSQNSTRAGQLGDGTGILSDGTIYYFQPWYDSDFADLRLTMLTPTSENFGILWGFGIGESGRKYEIDPSLKVGFLATQPVGDQGLLSLSVSVVLGGYLRERPCTADYGAIGGVQSVNCRMAGSFLAPSATLDYLVNEPPADQVSVALRYRWEF